MVQLDVDYNHVNWTFALPCFGLAVGPLLVGALADTYGRRPILILSTCIAVVASGCTAIKDINFAGYMAARFFQGLGAGPSANIGLCIINDISWEHERGTRVGLWTIAANCGTILGGVCKYLRAFVISSDISSRRPPCRVRRMGCLPCHHPVLDAPHLAVPSATRNAIPACYHGRSRAAQPYRAVKEDEAAWIFCESSRMPFERLLTISEPAQDPWRQPSCSVDNHCTVCKALRVSYGPYQRYCLLLLPLLVGLWHYHPRTGRIRE